jgi:hypothetical protein
VAHRFAPIRAVTCAWCGVERVEGNHGSLAECVEALKREVEVLRRELAAQQRAKDAPAADTPAEGDRPPWKFRKS